MYPINITLDVEYPTPLNVFSHLSLTEGDFFFRISEVRYIFFHIKVDKSKVTVEGDVGVEEDRNPLEGIVSFRPDPGFGESVKVTYAQVKLEFPDENINFPIFIKYLLTAYEKAIKNVNVGPILKDTFNTLNDPYVMEVKMETYWEKFYINWSSREEK